MVKARVRGDVWLLWRLQLVIVAVAVVFDVMVVVSSENSRS